MSTASALTRLADRPAQVSTADIAASMVPPPQFQHATFENYRPDTEFPSQVAALERLNEFAGAWRAAQRPGGFFARNRKPRIELPGVYLDGGFGVGKTHLLAALWHVAHGPKYFGTFIEYTAMVGALGYQGAVKLLTGARLLCIDEFELDDPGDTMMMSRLLGELMATGTRVAATSNTPPNALGEGRFAAQDFLREIAALASNFETVRIDGLDYRRRATSGEAVVAGDTGQVEHLAQAMAGAGHTGTLDSFAGVLARLGALHPSAYVRLVRDLDFIAITDVTQLHDQSAALRFVAFIDRVYDAQVPIVASGLQLDQVYDDEMLAGGFRKKYLRSISRLVALTTGELPPQS
ncbi:MAG TPA: cell division protein ZapE [Candidatus Lumbricidophila sp.]|nr:cell division protein ZapE [Candidatus Lumbricidophila sp.]